MKTLKIYLKPMAFFFLVLIMLQSCTVYKSTPITLEQAVNKESKVRITTNTNNTFIYKKVVFDNEKYYGVEKKKGKMIKIPINQDLVKSIKAENSTLSFALSMGISIVSVLGIAFIASNDLGWKWK